MKKDMDSAYKGYDDSQWNDNNYVANILQRHVQQRTASLYAKNPRATAKRRDRMDYAVWDKDEKTLATAYEAMATAQDNQLPPPAEAAAVVSDYEQGHTHRKMLDNVAKTLEQLFHYFMAEQQPSFKSQMKALVRRVVTTGVGFVKVGFQRDMDRMPEISNKIHDVQMQIDYLYRIASEAADGTIDRDDAQIEALQLSLKALLEEPMVIMREGLTFDFPESDAIIIDPKCRQLRGFVGANWVAHEMYVSPDEIKEIYGVDIKNKYRPYVKESTSTY